MSKLNTGDEDSHLPCPFLKISIKANSLFTSCFLLGKVITKKELGVGAGCCISAKATKCGMFLEINLAALPPEMKQNIGLEMYIKANKEKEKRT